MDEERIKQIVRSELRGLLASDRYVFERRLQILDGRDIQLATGTGTKIGTSTTEKLAFHNATPVVQHVPTGVTAGFTDSGSGTLMTEQDTVTGNVGSSIWNIGDIVAALKLKGIIQS